MMEIILDVTSVVLNVIVIVFLVKNWRNKK